MLDDATALEVYEQIKKTQPLVTFNLRKYSYLAEDILHDSWIKVMETNNLQSAVGFGISHALNSSKLRLAGKYKSRSKYAAVNVEDIESLKVIEETQDDIPNVMQYLKNLPPKYRELLERFYLREEDRDTIMHEMNLTKKAFDLLKNRALAKIRDRFHIKPKGCVCAY